jgi:hypothetical protein
MAYIMREGRIGQATSTAWPAGAYAPFGKGHIMPRSADVGFAAMQDEHALEMELWLWCGIEAYSAGLMSKIVCRPRGEVVAAYLAECPALRRWCEHHVSRGTCAEAVRVLRQKRCALAAQRQAERPKKFARPPDPNAVAFKEAFARFIRQPVSLQGDLPAAISTAAPASTTTEPSEISVDAPPAVEPTELTTGTDTQDPRIVAIRAALVGHIRPGSNSPWGQFHAAILTECGAKETDRGFGLRQIQRLVEKELERH